MKRVSLALMAFVLGGCADTALVNRVSTLEKNQGQLVGAVNVLAACKADKDPKQPIGPDCPKPQAAAPLAPTGK